MDLTLGDGTAGAGNVALKLVAGMTYTKVNTATSALVFVSTSATQQTVTTAGKTTGNTTFSGAGSSYILGDALTHAAVATFFTLTQGTFNTGGFACSFGQVLISTAGTKVLTLGTSAVAVSGVSGAAVNYSGSNATFTANTAVMTLSGTTSGIVNGNWNGTSVVFSSTVTSGTLNAATLNNVTYANGANKTSVLNISNPPTITGTLTVTGNSTINRVFVLSNVVGTARTVTVGTGFSFANVDFSDITAAGAAGAWTGTSMGNALGNTNITFDAPDTQTHTASAGGNWSDITKWTSRVPLPQDNVVVDVNTTGTLTADMPRLGADVTFAGFAGTAAFNSVANTIYGSLVLGAGMTVSGTQQTVFASRSAKTITSNGKAFTQALAIFAFGGTYTLTDALTTTGGGASFLLGVGTFLSANFPVTCSQFEWRTGSTITLGTSVITMTSTAAVTLVIANTGATTSVANATFVVGAASANTRTFQGAGYTYGTLTYTVAGSTGSLTITGANTFGTINFSDASNARSLLFTAATTTTVTNLNVTGTAGKLMTIDSSTAATHTLSKSSGTVARDYLNVANSIVTGGATWFAGANSTNGGGNTGWIFRAPGNSFLGMVL